MHLHIRRSTSSSTTTNNAKRGFIKCIFLSCIILLISWPFIATLMAKQFLWSHHSYYLQSNTITSNQPDNNIISPPHETSSPIIIITSDDNTKQPTSSSSCTLLPLSITTKILFISSITRPYRDHAALETNWHNTLWENLQHPDNHHHQNNNTNKPLNASFWIYVENEWEIKHNRIPLTCEDFPSLRWPQININRNCCLRDIFQYQPQLYSLDIPIKQFYTLPHTPGLNVRIMDGMVLVRKIASIVDALHSLRDGQLLIWLDVDVQPIRQLDDLFLQFVSSRDISYLPETICWRDLLPTSPTTVPVKDKTFFNLDSKCRDIRIDTGIIVFKVNDRTRRFVKWWFNIYKNGLVTTLATYCLGNQTTTIDNSKSSSRNKLLSLNQVYTLLNMTTNNNWEHICSEPTIRSNLGLNDIYTFALSLFAFRNELQHGWFAAPLRNSYCQRTSGDNNKIIKYPGGHCHPCPSTSSITNSLTSPFDLFHYLIHIKGGHGIMARQHNHHDSAPKTKTHDEELHLPPEYFPIVPQHVDHRMACGDKRSIFGVRWSLNQL
jgi:hypothetical protein